jgi:hypothetical protein
MIEIKGLDEDDLFDEFSSLKSAFKTVLDQPVSVFDQVQSFIQKQINTAKDDYDDGKEDDDDDHSIVSKVVRSDQLWMYLFSFNHSPNFKKLVSFLYSLSCRSDQDLLKAIRSDEKYTFKRKLSQ